ncbi:MAG: hypothetical protein IPG46_10290 [Actinobacteria bacterium]|nr:hypothetical protein [Actinomycetota bacterium]
MTGFAGLTAAFALDGAGVLTAADSTSSTATVSNLTQSTTADTTADTTVDDRIADHDRYDDRFADHDRRIGVDQHSVDQHE